MKRSLHIIAMAALAIAVHAETAASELILKSANKSWFTARLNNGPVTVPSGRIEFNNLPAGYHHVTLYGMNQPGSPFAIVLFSNMIYVPDGVIMKTVLRENGTLSVAEVRPVHQGPPPNFPYQPLPPMPGNACYNNQYGPACNSNMFTTPDFEMLCNTISNQSFDDTRLSIARQALKNRMLNTSQVIRLINLFTFESTKLSFAKFAYQNVYDRNNYFWVNDAFTFSSSIDELTTYINHNG